MINLPYRFMKSTLVSVMWPAWEWIDNPSHQWLCGSHSLGLAIRDNRAMRLLVESPWYRERWGDVFNLTSDQNQKIRFENDQRGYRLAFSMKSGVLGEGGDKICVDDPHDREQSQSEVERATALETFDQSVATRLNDPKTSAIVIIMQRLHENDLSGHVLASGDWDHLLIPMHYDPERAKTTFVIGWHDPRTKPGELAWPERFPEEVVEREAKRLGPYGAAGQLEQRPAPAEGGILKEAWWKFYYDDEIFGVAFDERIQSWDLALTGDADFVAGQAWARKGANCYLMPDEVYEQLNFPDTITAMIKFSAKWPDGAKYVENKANGPAAISTLKDRIPGLIPVNPDGDKTVRAHSVAPYVAAGNVFLPSPYDRQGNPRSDRAWVLRLVKNAGTFPAGSDPVGSHGDDIDALTQAVHQLLHRQECDGTAVLGFMKDFVRDIQAEAAVAKG